MSELAKEFEATLRARQEVGKELEPQLVERFVEQLEQEIDRRVEAHLAHRRLRAIDPRIPLGSVALGIGATAVANSVAVSIIAWVAIAILNIAYAIRH
jgi:hypothetical protein